MNLNVSVCTFTRLLFVTHLLRFSPPKKNTTAKCYRYFNRFQIIGNVFSSTCVCLLKLLLFMDHFSAALWLKEIIIIIIIIISTSIHKANFLLYSFTVDIKRQQQWAIKHTHILPNRNINIFLCMHCLNHKMKWEEEEWEKMLRIAGWNEMEWKNYPLSKKQHVFKD